MIEKPALTVAAAALLALSACVNSIGGSGQTSSGSPLVAEAIGDQSARTTQLIISSPRGWKCEGLHIWPTTTNGPPKSTKKIDLTCNQGLHGNGIMSFEQMKDRITLAFALSNGEEGSVSFGN